MRAKLARGVNTFYERPITLSIVCVILAREECLATTFFAVEFLFVFVLVLFVLVLFVHQHFVMCLDIFIIIIYKMAKHYKTGVQASRS